MDCRAFYGGVDFGRRDFDNGLYASPVVRKLFDGSIVFGFILFISIMILALHIIFMCVDYYATEKAAVVKYCNRIKKENSSKNA